MFHGQFCPDTVGLWTFRVDGWGDPIATWRRAVVAKLDAGQSETELSNDLLVGARLLERAATGMPRKLRDPLIEAAEALRKPGDPFTRAGAALSEEVSELLDAVSAARRDHPRRPTRRVGGPACGPFQRVVRDVPAVHRRLGQEGQAGPRHVRHRGQGAAPHRQDGFRRGVPAADPSRSARFTARAATTSVTAAPKDVGSPWAIGSDAVATTPFTPSWARSRTSTTSSPRPATRAWRWRWTWRCRRAPDHPWAKEHPEWFTVLPDGTIAYAENPPKKYQDIYPINFDNDPVGIYNEVLRVVRFWISHGVKIFRVDNPHTKPPNFWAWLIGQVKATDPDVLFLSEAFTRPARLYGLAKLGFTQSYTLLHLAHREVGADRVRRADRRARRLRPPEPVRQHARHPARKPAARRPGHVRDPGGAGVDIQPGVGRVFRLRAVRAPRGSRGQRGIPRLGEVRIASPRFRGRTGQGRVAGAVLGPAQRDSPAASRVARAAHA